MHYAFDEDQETYAQEVRKFAVKTLAPHYQADDKAAEFRRCRRSTWRAWA